MLEKFPVFFDPLLIDASHKKFESIFMDTLESPEGGGVDLATLDTSRRRNPGPRPHPPDSMGPDRARQGPFVPEGPSRLRRSRKHGVVQPSEYS